MNARILCGYDGSAAAEKSFESALTLAKGFSAELCVLAVAQPPEPPEDVETEALLESAEARFEQQFTRAAAEGCGHRPDATVRGRGRPSCRANPLPRG